jgi:hypothetical protein
MPTNETERGLWSDLEIAICAAANAAYLLTAALQRRYESERDDAVIYGGLNFEDHAKEAKALFYKLFESVRASRPVGDEIAPKRLH